MIEELQKVATLPLEESAYLRPISGKGIGFYNLDKNTAQFQFRVTKDNFPLLLSNQNIKGYAFFKENVTKKGVKPSISGVLDIDFIDPMKGIIGVTVPSWFLKNVANSNVLGEVYLSLNDVKNEGNDDTVVLGTFAFDVRDSLVNQISSDIKVSYIRMFDDLRTELELKVQQLKEDIGDVTSLIESIKQIANDTLSKINKAQADAISAITDTLLSSTTSIDLERDEALRQIDAKRDAVKTDYDLSNDTFKQLVSNSTQAFNDNATNANKTIDDKVSAFNQTLNAGGFTTQVDVDSKLTTLAWQKFKLTNDDGTNFYDSTLSVDFSDSNQLMNLPIGTRYVVNSKNQPMGTSINGWLTKFNRTNEVMLVQYQPYNSNVIYQKRFYNTWSDWEQVNNSVVDTGWINLQLINGASPNNSLISNGGFTSAYRSITSNGITRKMIRLNATTLTHGQTLALLPKGFVNNLMFFGISTPRNKNRGRISLNTSGTVNFDATVDPTAWTNTDYIYGQYEWTE